MSGNLNFIYIELNSVPCNTYICLKTTLYSIQFLRELERDSLQNLLKTKKNLTIVYSVAILNFSTWVPILKIIHKISEFNYKRHYSHAIIPTPLIQHTIICVLSVCEQEWK